jgi:amidase
LENILDLDATAQIQKLKSKEISPKELMEATLNRIENVNPKVNAIVSIQDREILLNTTKKTFGGPLHGLPMAIKDLEETKGITTTFGSPIYKDYKPNFDSNMVSNIKKAGGIIIGKTNVPEFGLGSHTYNHVFGKTLNPYNLTKTCGGSSGGAAVALATNMISLGDGSDMMGSLRNPASWCNIFGFRPSFGLVPNGLNNEVFLNQISTNGPMARSVRDIELLLSIQSKLDPSDPHSYGPYEPVHETSRKYKIAWLGDWGGAYKIDPIIINKCEASLKILEAQGHEIVEPKPIFPANLLWEAWTTLRSWTLSEKHKENYNNSVKRKLLKPEVIWETEKGLALTPEDIFKASKIRSAWFKETSKMSYDALVLPSTQVLPFSTDMNWPNQILDKEMDTYHRWMEVVIPASLTGLPSISVPIGFSPDDTPLGMQLIGHRRNDANILALAKQYESDCVWLQEKPNL